MDLAFGALRFFMDEVSELGLAHLMPVPGRFRACKS
jgi:hypothetical protein